MHRKAIVAGTATAVLALVTVTGTVGSHVPSSVQPVSETAFTTITPASVSSTTASEALVLDPAYRSAGNLESGSAIVESGAKTESTGSGPVAIPDVAALSAVRPPKYTLKGQASWYDNGTTAMRLPRGTVVRICGPAACIERTVTDYGPAAAIFPNRIADLTPADFRMVCGCSTSSGITTVTVGVY